MALEAARAAVAVHRRHLGRVRVEDWAEKGTADFVTDVDREAERAAIGRVRARFPDHGILAEEGTVDAPWTQEAGDGQPEWLWVIDPLDGTTNFLHGYPMYSASVAALEAGELVAAAVVSGGTGEEWTATRGGGAFKDGSRIGVSRIERLDQALIGTGFPFRVLHLLPAYLDQLERVIRRTAGVRRAGSAALDLCHLATGYFDGFWELYLSPWDFAAGTLIVREAGGLITRLDGDPDVLKGDDILAGNPVIYRLLADVVRGAP